MKLELKLILIYGSHKINYDNHLSVAQPITVSRGTYRKVPTTESLILIKELM